MKQVLSIDVGKAQLSACLSDQSKVLERRVINNDRDEITQLFSAFPDAWIVADAASSYHNLLVEVAWQSGRRIALARGVDVRNYARSQRTRVKTDKVDAEMIGRYAMATDLRDFEPCKCEKLALRTLLRQRACLSRHRAAVRQAGASKALIKAFEEEIAKLDERIATLASMREALYLRLQSIPGVGKVVAASLVALLWDIEQFKSRGAVTCFAGLDIALHESGSYRGKGRLSKQGDPELRRLLFLAAAACVFMAKGPVWEMYSRLRQRTTNPLPAHAAITACARKLLQTAWSMARSGQQFVPARFAMALDKMA